MNSWFVSDAGPKPEWVGLIVSPCSFTNGSLKSTDPIGKTGDVELLEEEDDDDPEPVPEGAMPKGLRSVV